MNNIMYDNHKIDKQNKSFSSTNIKTVLKTVDLAGGLVSKLLYKHKR